MSKKRDTLDMDIDIYGRSSPPCSYCKRAVDIAFKADMNIMYHDFAKGQWDMKSLSEKVGSAVTTIPQIFVNGKYIGGFEELYRFINPKG